MKSNIFNMVFRFNSGKSAVRRVDEEEYRFLIDQIYSMDGIARLKATFVHDLPLYIEVQHLECIDYEPI